MPDSRTSVPDTLHEALRILQHDLPQVGKDNEADTGKYKYRYADLPTIHDLVLPLLSDLGLTWTTAPTTLDGAAVLHYRLEHYLGDAVEGFYPLGSTTQAPQALGSAITYARRYALLAVTGIAPADDDGKAASTPPEMPEAHEPPKDWRTLVEDVKTLADLQRLYEDDAVKWFTEEVKLAFTARKVALGG